MKNNKLFRTASAVIVSATLLSACKDDVAAPQDMGQEFFPLKVGHWVEYQVDSLWRDDVLNVLDSVSYRLLERIEEVHTDAGGRTAYRILRYVPDASGNWEVRDVWTAYRDQRGAEMTEENMRRLKLSFPVREARTWDINVYNTDRLLDVAFRELDEPWASDSLSFDKSVLVRNVLGPNAVEKRNFEERYVRDVGLVEKYWEETNTQVSGVRGFRMRMVAVAHGDQ